MKFEFCNFEDIQENIWQSLLARSRCNLNYEKYFVDYQTISYPVKNLSGVVFSNSIPIAMFVVYADELQKRILPMSLPPIYFTENPNVRLSVNKFYLEMVQHEEELQEFVLRNTRNITWLPQTNALYSDLGSNAEFEELIIELEEPENVLFSKLSRNHKRTIKNSIEIGQRVIQISSDAPKAELDFYFKEYRDLHITVSGRETRPIQSFDFMKNLIQRKTSKLFVSISEGEPISFLYCDSNREYARGWSQVTKPNLGSKIFPRTLLEWTAMLSYKAEGRIVYHLGTHKKRKPNAITDTLGFEEFKRRFGPTIIP